MQLLRFQDSPTDFETKRAELKELTSLQAVQSNKICILSIENAFGTGPSVVSQVRNYSENKQMSTVTTINEAEDFLERNHPRL